MCEGFASVIREYDTAQEAWEMAVSLYCTTGERYFVCEGDDKTHLYDTDDALPEGVLRWDEDDYDIDQQDAAQ